jgi:hypothetical protein
MGWEQSGWQRLWLVGTLCLTAWLVVWMPLQDVAAALRWTLKESDRYTLEQDLKNPQCSRYRPPTPPDWNMSNNECSELRYWRRYTPTQHAPFTLEVFDRVRDDRRREVWLTSLGIGAAITTFVSALVYFCGWVIAGSREAFNAKLATSSVSQNNFEKDRCGAVELTALPCRALEALRHGSISL